MNGESSFQGQPSYVGKTSNKKRLVIIFLVLLVIIIAGLGGLYLMGAPKHPVKTTNPIPTEALTATTPTEVATPSAALSSTPAATSGATATNTSLKISVLNGSGTPGAASQVATALKTAGFADVTTGNANAYTYTGITIHVKKSEYLPSIQKEITTASPNVKVKTGVDPTISSDVEVIIGK